MFLADARGKVTAIVMRHDSVAELTAVKPGLAAEQKAIGKLLGETVALTNLGEAMADAIESWLANDLPEDWDGRPAMPFPVCTNRRRDSNSRSEKLVLLAAAYRQFCLAAEPILAVALQFANEQQHVRWNELVTAVGALSGADLRYLNEYLDELSGELIGLMTWAKECGLPVCIPATPRERIPFDSTVATRAAAVPQSPKQKRERSNVRGLTDLELIAKLDTERRKNPNMTQMAAARILGCNKGTLTKRIKKGGVFARWWFANINERASQESCRRKSHRGAAERIRQNGDDED